MTKVITTCDFCERQMTGDERICLKRKAGKHGGEMNFDICPDCWRLLKENAKRGVSKKAIGNDATCGQAEIDRLRNFLTILQSDTSFTTDDNGVMCRQMLDINKRIAEILSKEGGMK